VYSSKLRQEKEDYLKIIMNTQMIFIVFCLLGKHTHFFIFYFCQFMFDITDYNVEIITHLM
jgi:hypothetical protein